MKANIKKCYRVLNVVLLGVIFNVACNNEEHAEELTDNFEPLSCTIPGELQLNDTTKKLLDKYQR